MTHRGRSYRLDRSVFDPAQHLSGVVFADQLDELVPDGSTVLEIGTGCGLLAAVAAQRARRVVATDLNPRAVACARHNLADLGVEVRCGDLFEPVAGERFDLVIVNPPYEIRRRRDIALGSPDFLVRFGASVFDHTDRAVIAYPADDVATLAITGLHLVCWRRVPTAGHDLGIFTADNPAADNGGADKT